MRTFFDRIQPISNVHLPFVSVYQRLTDFAHTLAYASVIRNSVTGVLPTGYGKSLIFMMFPLLHGTSTYGSENKPTAQNTEDKGKVFRT